MIIAANKLRNRNSVPARQLAQAIGTLISLQQALGDIVYLRTKHSQFILASQVLTNWNISVNLSPEAKAEWEFWFHHIQIHNGMPIFAVIASDTVVFSDASSTGCAAAFRFHSQVQEVVIHKVFTQSEEASSSTSRELIAVAHGLDQAKHLLYQHSILWHTDSKNVVAILKRGSMIQSLQNLAVNIFNICQKHRILLHPVWIPRRLNDHADALSRIVDSNNWSVTPSWFSHICKIFKLQVDYDRFADDSNNQVPKFNSRFFLPTSAGVDAFAQNWQNVCNWAVPPIYLIPRLLQFITKQPCLVILVLPEWPSAIFWPHYVEFRNLQAKHIRKIMKLGNIFARGSSDSSIFGSNKWKSNTLAILYDSLSQDTSAVSTLLPPYCNSTATIHCHHITYMSLQ